MSDIERYQKRLKRTRSKRVGSSSSTGRSVYIRPYHCTVDGCTKAFTRAEHLKRHQLNHKSAKVWTCKACALSFVRRDLWDRHLRITHDENAFNTEHDPTEVDFESIVSSVPERAPTTNIQGKASSLSETGVSQAETFGGLQTSNISTISTDAASLLLGQSDKSSILPVSSLSSLDIPVPFTGIVGADDLGNCQTEKLQHPITDTWCAPFDAPWVQEMEEWHSDFAAHQGTRFTDTDIAWFFQNQQDWPEGDFPLDETPSSSETPVSAPLRDAGTIMSEINNVNGQLPPVFFQDLQSKIFVAKTGEFDPPNCGFRTCNALTDERRIELLMDLRNLTEVDLRDPIFSLNSMKQGIHLFSRNLNIEYPFLHHELLYPSSTERREAIVDVFGEEPGPQLLWVVITLGWSLMRSDNNHEAYMASKIQRAMRTSIINHPGLTNTPPLWIVQTLFLLLLFARYLGNREEYGFASMFHGVLLEATRRLDYRSDRNGVLPQPQSGGPSILVWMKWIQTETIRRLILQTFTLDVKHAILHGGEVSMTPFELNIKLPFSEDAWYATSPTEWKHLLSLTKEEPVAFLPMLKRSWNPVSTKMIGEALPRGANMIMYGLISIAREISRREETSLSNRTANTLISLGHTVRRSFEVWEASWKKMPSTIGLKSYAWRNCLCTLRLAHTLYEISPVDLQTVAGKEIIEGKRRGVADYTQSKRKLRQWVKHDRASLGVSYAANLIHERLTEESPVTHCHHCLWCLYLAGLVCWNFGFALTKTTTGAQDLIADGQIVSMNLAEKECHVYLDAAINFPRGASKTRLQALSKPTGMLIVLSTFLKARCETGMIGESIELLTRLAGVSSLPST